MRNFLSFWETCTGNVSRNDICRAVRVHNTLLSVIVLQFYSFHHTFSHFIRNYLSPFFTIIQNIKYTSNFKLLILIYSFILFMPNNIPFTYICTIIHSYNQIYLTILFNINISFIFFYFFLFLQFY